MAINYRWADEVKEVAERLIPEYHPHLTEAKIGYLFRDGNWSSKCRETWAAAQKVSGQNHFMTGFDLLITVHEAVWEQLDDAGQEALIDHELCHFGKDEDKYGNPTYFIIGHDVEEHLAVIRRRGLWRPELKKAVVAANDYKQGEFFTQENIAKLKEKIANVAPKEWGEMTVEVVANGQQ